MAKQYFSLREAMTLLMRESRDRIWSPYQLSRLFFSLYNNRTEHPFLLKVRNDIPGNIDYKRIISELIKFDVIKTKNGRIFFRLPKENFFPGEIVCSADPFAYLSHFSAMVFHKLTNQKPEKTCLSSYPTKKWTIEATLLMKKHFGENYTIFKKTGLPTLKNIDVSNMETPIAYKYQSPNMGSFELINYDRTKIASIGRTFLDMIRRPDLCGGIKNVIEVYKKKAPLHANPIVQEIELFGNKIEKIRAGYLLEEVCGITNEIIEGWKKNAMRGGSRKLDPFAEYAPIYSEQWQLSLNINGS